MSTVEQSILQMLMIPQVRDIAAGHCQSWMFSSELCRHSFNALIDSRTDRASIPDPREFMLRVHSAHGVSEDDCALIYQMVQDVHDNPQYDLESYIAHITDFIRDRSIGRGVELIAGSSDNSRDKIKGQDYLQYGLNFSISTDQFYDFSDIDRVATARDLDMPPDGSIIKSHYGLVNRSSLYGGYQFGDLIGYAGRPGGGKCWRRDEPIMLADGSIRLSQEIEVGDQLMGPDGSPRTVLELHTGQDEMYRVTATNGESFVVNSRHLLHLEINPEYHRDAVGAVMDIAAPDFLLLPERARHHSYLVKTEGLQFPAAQHEVEPYMVGALLGDGSLHGGVVLYSADPEMLEYVQQYAEQHQLAVTVHQNNGCLKIRLHNSGKPNPVLAALRRLDMMGRNWNNKHVPTEYLRDSTENRLQLLAGLLDTDGHLNARGDKFEFANKSQQLAEDVLWLARSLGFRASLAYKETNSQYVQGSPGYRVHISGHLDQIPTKIARKQANPRVCPKAGTRYGIRSIEAIGVDDYYGWEVDGDHLHLDGRFFVQHNSTSMVCDGAYSIYQGFRTCHIFLGDMSEYDAFLKYLSYWSGVTTDRILQDGYERYITPEIAAMFRRLRVKSLPADQFNVYQVLAKANQLRANFPFEMLCIDYDANIKNAGQDGMYGEGGNTYANLKSYGQSKCVVLVGSQLKNEYWDYEIVPLNALAESSKKQHHLDMLLTIGRNKTCPTLGTLNIAKMRRGMSEVQSRLHLDFPSTRLREVSQDRYNQMLAEHKSQAAAEAALEAGEGGTSMPV